MSIVALLLNLIIFVTITGGVIHLLNVAFGRMFANFIARCLKSNRAWR